MTWRVAWCLISAVLTVGAAGCRATDEPSRGYQFGPGDEYVALGDSYTAAPGTGPSDDDDGCGRSLTNYPHQVAEATGATLVDNSCGGATTAHLRQPQPTPAGSHPPQLNGIRETTDLVTIRLGGNDYNLFAGLVACASLGAPSGSPCADADAAAGDASARSRLQDVEDNLIRALADIQDRAPEARIIVVGYPEIVPPEGTCDLLPLAEGDHGWAREVNEGFNQALEAAAAEQDVEFVDLAPATEGHDVCADEPWVAGAQATRGRATPWHPYPEEGRAVARLVLAELED